MFKTAIWLIVIVIVTSISFAYGQEININQGVNITNMPGDESDAHWSGDSKNLLFQSLLNGKSTICIYQSENDTVLCFNGFDYSLRNPVWHPDGNKIVFDSDREDADHLYVLDIATNNVSQLLNRKIKSRNASFSTSSRQVYFTGYDELIRSWEIYSYDFVYDNLNRLTDYRLGSSNCDVSSDGKQIAFCKENPFNKTSQIEVINWYGDSVAVYEGFNGLYPSWGPSGFKLYFVSDMDNDSKEVYSIWKDGSHLERLTFDEIKVASPVLSPDGTKIAISVLTNKGWDIYIIPFSD